ncbi:HD domain-containing protein [Bradyrhizobium sp. CCBAU 53415]|uniref:HD domain-containing protein n=1 Tax=Bradyrhizobium sp. CCBAU 53415 TaxID=1325119 RepID=UPI0023060C8C|nr:HD domain-containing protein [Bradyrhizobium sp. CCBAU 53415]
MTFANSSPLLRAVISRKHLHVQPLPSLADAAVDVEGLLRGFGLQLIRRYAGQIHWEQESQEASFADRAEPGLKLENVAAHSWHVADTVLLVAPHFPFLDLARALKLALIHDKLELITGDFDPVGSDGRGTHSHAFHPEKRKSKVEAELRALDMYLAGVREAVRDNQRDIFLDAIHGRSAEARFVKAIDKLQALAYVLVKKGGNLTDSHLAFSLRFSRMAIDYFPGIQSHYAVLFNQLLDSVAAFRNLPRERIESEIYGQLEFDLRVL